MFSACIRLAMFIVPSCKSPKKQNFIAAELETSTVKMWYTWNPLDSERAEKPGTMKKSSDM
jgi:hypothetical protein